MEVPTNKFRLMRFWSDEWPEADRFPVWRELVTNRLLQADVQQTVGDPFHALVYMRALPTLRFGWGTVGASHYERTRKIVAADNNDFVLMMNLQGAFSVSQPGRSVKLEPGDAFLTACSETGAFSRVSPGKILFLRMPHESVATVVRNAYSNVGRLIPHNTEGLRLLAGYLRLLDEGDPLTSAKAQSIVTGHVRDLLALTLGSLGDALEASEERGGVKAARLAAIKAHIDGQSADHDLTAGSVAAFFRISERHLQRLFKEEGATFSNFVLAKRLSNAYEAIVRGRDDDARNISQIAYDCGFGDISYFNRCFRRRYGSSPARLRSAPMLRVH
ncbi:MAG TPA: AraC family transcriptional regulator [Rhizomicrobium sp.]|jgi:AraC-like DNA-binding protein|nr:AraC family transcriptional regulator [Rhizomicrobium sp.]